jgi:hypothetical protein
LPERFEHSTSEPVALEKEKQNEFFGCMVSLPVAIKERENTGVDSNSD